MTQEKQPASRPMDSGGESGGGAYPNPHTGKDKTPDFKGGQSDQSYYGGGQLGDEDVGENSNAVSTEEQE